MGCGSHIPRQAPSLPPIPRVSSPSSAKVLGRGPARARGGRAAAAGRRWAKARVVTLRPAAGGKREAGQVGSFQRGIRGERAGGRAFDASRVLMTPAVLVGAALCRRLPSRSGDRPPNGIPRCPRRGVAAASRTFGGAEAKTAVIGIPRPQTGWNLRGIVERGLEPRGRHSWQRDAPGSSSSTSRPRLKRSMEFFKTLGMEFDSQFTDENAACMIVNEQAYVMLLGEPFFRRFTRKGLCDTSSFTEGLFALACDSRAEVDRDGEDRDLRGGAHAMDPVWTTGPCTLELLRPRRPPLGGLLDGPEGMEK